MISLGNIVIPNIMPHLLGVLGLLLLWQYHQMQVMAGRIQAVDFWDRSGIRMFIHAVAHDGKACGACQGGDGMAFVPSLATKKDFSPQPRACLNSSACRSLSVGLYGGWAEAHTLIQRLRREGKKKPVKLTQQDIKELFDGRWERSISGSADRIAIHMLEAMPMEETDPEASLFRYRFVVEQATGARDLYFVVPSYFGLVSGLERLGQFQEALKCIDKFEERFAEKKQAPHFPTETQRGLMSIQKSRLVMRLREESGGIPRAATMPGSPNLSGAPA